MAAIAPPAPAIDVTLSLFGGTDTEIAAPDLPEGLSPDNQDMIFFPGEVASRPGLRKLYSPAIEAGVSVLYQKTFVQPNGDPLTLILTSDGLFWREDVAFPGILGLTVVRVPAGLYAQSVTAFGREYIAFSDLLHGQDVPLQYDGTFFDRVTMDGPGAPPVVGDESISQAITASPNGLFPISAALNVQSGSEAGFLVTLVLAASSSIVATLIVQCFRAQDIWQIAGVGAGYDGSWAVLSCIAFGSAVTITYYSTTGSLASVGVAGSATDSYYTVVNTVAPGNLPGAGNSVTIAGAGVAGYDGSWPVRLVATPSQGTFYVYIASAFSLAASGNGTWSITGNVSVGLHQAVVMWLTRQGWISAPSPIFSWTAAGGKRAVFSNLPIGPSNVIARVIGLTGAGGDNFFIIPSPSFVLGTTTQIFATVVPDNTSTTFTIDFSDNALFAAVPIDQIGNDLFDQIVLGSVLGFFSFADRLGTWGDFNKVENFLNMGFCGGQLSGVPTVPLGWTVDTAGGILVNGGSWVGGESWQITGDGSGNPRGRIFQTAYRDSFGDAILSPNTPYQVRFWAKANTANGIITVDFFDTNTSTVLRSATVSLTAISASGGFVQAAFNGPTASVITSTTVLRISETGMPNAALLTLGELEIVFAVNPYRGLSRWSYVLNPEAFAQTTGNLGASGDSSPIQNFSLQKDTGLLHTGEATHEFTDNTFEPGEGGNSWPVRALTHSVGCLSLKGCDPGKFGTGDSAEDWDIIASKNGVYIHLGSSFYKVAQEMSRTIGTAPNAVTWDDINWAAQQTVWVKNLVNKRYALIGVPVNGATQPNVVFVLDYREMDTAAQIASALPIHITLTGKMKSSDMTRKWTRWNIPANCGEVLVRPGNVLELFLGGGQNANGNAFGNLYSLDPAKLTDDDYGQISPYYFTYAFLDHDQEQMLQLGSDRKLVKHISAFITGVGLVTITPYVNSLLNPLPATTPRALSGDTTNANTLGSDLEWTTTIHGQRVFFKISVSPLPGATDVQLKLQKLIVLMQKDPVALFRGSRI